MKLPFNDRADAAKQLASALKRYEGSNPLVLAIPRGGVPIARVVADALHGELDVVLVRKIGAPRNPEFAIGAIDESGSLMLSDDAARSGADSDYICDEAAQQLAVIRERRKRYAGSDASSNMKPVAGRTVIVVDDGLATGATMSAALSATRAKRPKRLICAVPVAAQDSLRSVAELADDVVCLATPEPFMAVGRFYSDFSSVEERDVIELLRGETDTRRSAIERYEPRISSVIPAQSDSAVRRRAVVVKSDSVAIEGDLVIPDAAHGVILFAHGSGSSRHSSRNRFVASELNRLGFATLLIDLLTTAEDTDRRMRFDMGLLSKRLLAALEWLLRDPDTAGQPIGLFGASTGAAAALRVAAMRPESVGAVVSRGGRPDLAGAETLAAVAAPTLLIVGGADEEVLELNRNAQEIMGERAQIEIVPGATHLFEEAGTLERVASLAGDWFTKRLLSQR